MVNVMMFSMIWKFTWILFNLVLISGGCEVSYKLITQKQKWTDARIDCWNSGFYDLAIIDTPVKSSKAQLYLQQQFDSGVPVDEVYFALRKHNGIWNVTATLKKQLWSNWATGYPILDAKSNCASVRPSDGYKWADYLCWHKKYALCETPCREATLQGISIDKEITAPAPVAEYTVSTTSLCVQHCLASMDVCQFVQYKNNQCLLFDWNLDLNNSSTVLVPSSKVTILKVTS